MSSQRTKILSDVVDEHDALVRRIAELETELEEAQRSVASLQMELRGLEYVRLKDNEYLIKQLDAFKKGADGE